MSKSFYCFGIFTLCLYVIISLFLTYLQFQFGPPIFLRQSFLPLLFLSAIMYALTAWIMLKYFQFKNYQFAFFSLVVAATINLFVLLFFYKAITNNIPYTFKFILLIVMPALMLHSISLVVFTAGKNFWLRAAGIFGLILQIVYLSIYISGKYPSNSHLYVNFVKIQQWVRLAENLLPVLFVINFMREVKLLNAENVKTTSHTFFKSIMVVAGIISLISAIILGRNLVTDDRPFTVNTIVTERGKALAQSFEARTYVNNKGDSMRYRLMKPLDYDSNNHYPLVVCLHHGGTRGNDNVMQIEGSGAAQVLSKTENKKKYPAFLFVPQCPVWSSWGGGPSYPSVDDLVFETIRALEKEFKIDEKKRYVIGVSGGGYGSWHFICSRPKMFAAAIPICGGCNPALAKNVVDVPVWAFHGEKDDDVPVAFSRDMIEAIKKEGGHPQYTEFPNAGHNIWDQVNDTPGLWDWLFAQRRD